MAVHWRNWSRTASAVFADLVEPEDTDELARIVARARSEGYHVRALGSGHSFSPAAVTDGIAVRLTHLTGIVRHSGSEVTVGAGTRLRDLGDLLEPLGLAQDNLGDIDAQTLGGAISTGTHGTGIAHPGLSSQVSALRLVLADGSEVDCSADLRPGLFESARLGLGALGVITEVTLSCVPAFVLAADEHSEPLDAVLDDFTERMSAQDHVEFYWFPHTDVALIRSHRRLPRDGGWEGRPRWRELLEDEVLENGVLSAISALGSIAPPVVPATNRLATRLAGERRWTDRSPAVFASTRRVRFREMEYGLPIADLPEVLREVRRVIDDNSWRVSFPMEIRVAPADDVWLSPAYGRDTAYLAVQRYLKEPFAEFFLAVEPILIAAGGRPHWGKLHTQGHRQLRQVWPRLDDVSRVRRAVDPTGLFGNDYVNRVLGAV